MDKQQTIITITIMVIVVILSFVGSYFAANMGYQTKVDELTKARDKKAQENIAIVAKQDTNLFVPIDLVKTFMSEVKANNDGNARLYLSAKVQNMDIKNTLKLGDDLNNLIFGTPTETPNGEGYKVSMDFVVGTDGAKRAFVLIKEGGLWKISEIIAE
ncbi:MAG: hypothetical protein WCP14_00860 [bacterium]